MNTDDDACIWVMPAGTLIWAEATHNGEKHQVPFRLPYDTLVSGHPNMLRKAGAIQPPPGSQVAQAVSGLKPQQAATSSPPTLTDKRHDGSGQLGGKENA